MRAGVARRSLGEGGPLATLERATVGKPIVAHVLDARRERVTLKGCGQRRRANQRSLTTEYPANGSSFRTPAIYRMA